MKEIRKPKYILLDVGNVLVYKVTHEDENVAKLLGMTREEYRKLMDDVIENQTEVEKEAFQNMNTVEKEKEYLDSFHKTIFERLNIPIDNALIEKMTLCRMEGDFALREGVLEAVKKLSKEYRLGIFSNALPSRRVHELQIDDLDSYFEHIFISKEIGLEKPKLEAYEYVLDAIGVDKEEVMFVDDKLEYLEGAERAGITNLVMLGGDDCTNKYSVIKDLPELVDLLN